MLKSISMAQNLCQVLPKFIEMHVSTLFKYLLPPRRSSEVSREMRNACSVEYDTQVLVLPGTSFAQVCEQAQFIS
jgi:hypothetical protein